MPAHSSRTATRHKRQARGARLTTPMTTMGLTLLAAATLAVSACGGQGSTTTDTSAQPPPGSSQPASLWIPQQGMTWQVQYDGEIDLNVEAAVFDLDGEDTSADQVRQLKSAGKHPVCYINAGAWENWRSDKAKFPPSVLGKSMDEWPKERWLDIRKTDVLLPVISARMDVCRSKGFEAVDPDNVDGWTNGSGFPLTEADARRYVEELTKLAHQKGLSIGLKNSVGLIPSLTPIVDFAVNEQCLQYRECEAYRPFLNARKAVFHVEYHGTPEQVCKARPAGFSTIIKKVELDAGRQACPN